MALRELQNATFQQVTRFRDVGIVRILHDAENVRLLLWHALSSELSPIENLWSKIDERLAFHHTPLTTANELWNLVEVACASVPLHAIQYLCDSMHSRINSCYFYFRYCFLRLYLCFQISWNFNQLLFLIYFSKKYHFVICISLWPVMARLMSSLVLMACRIVKTVFERKKMGV